MEDRMNAGLLFVQLDQHAQDDLPVWDARLQALDGVTKVSWWKNLLVDRDDWYGDWRRIKEDFATLAICEITGSVDTFQKPPDVRCLLFVRAARPSQGVLRLPTMGLCIVMISARDAADEKGSTALRDWGDFVHFPGIVDANIPGYGLVTPYENIMRDAPRYLHLYEFPEADAEAVFQRTRPALAQRFNSQPGTAAFDHWATHPELVLDYISNFTRL